MKMKVLALTMAFLMMVGVVPVYAESVVSPSPEFDVALNPELDYLILVNDENPYEFGGTYDKALTKKDENGAYTAMTWVPDVAGDATLVEKAAFEAFVRLQADLAKKGILIQIYSGYRTEEDQQWLADFYKENPPIWKVSAAGLSGHHTGLELWIYVWDTFEGDQFLWGAETIERQKENPRFKLIHEVMPDYGFIDRYPEGKEGWTGTPAEPYEIRFVGSPEVAHEIMDNGLCLEEYLLNK